MNETHSIEPELLGRTPRRTVLVNARALNGLRALRLFLIPFVLIGLGVLWQALSATVVNSFGRTLPASIDAVMDDSDSDGSSCQVDYTYQVSGRTYNQHASLNYAACGSLEPDMSVPVKTITSMPQLHSELQYGNIASAEASQWGIALFWNAIVWIFVGCLWLIPANQRKLVADGVPGIGKITAKNQGEDDGTKYYSLKYTFIPEGSAASAVNADARVEKDEWDGIEVGDQITVLYNPSKPSPGLLYRFNPYRAVPY